ncbi:MAG: phosphoglucosamine mutase [Tissierellia bacterium]|nr:phosphoglucosamine mutase [Tissierellia bacterium]
MSKLFGTDGIRGVANRELTSKLAYHVGRAAAFCLKQDGKNTILIGRDTRRSGDMLQASLTSGILSIGMDVLDVGIIPTPGVAMLCRHYDVAAGIVISASHNPGEFNGIKLFGPAGYKLPDEKEDEIEGYVLQPERIDWMPIGTDIGILKQIPEATHIYIDYLKTKINRSLTGLKIAMDCGHGATLTVAPQLFKELGAEVYAINTDYDGMDINRNCGSTDPKLVAELVKEVGADIGLAFDGDGDRLIAVDELGEVMNGDHYLAACGTNLMNKGKLPNNTIVSTVMCNMGLVEYGKKVGMNVLQTAVGDRYVLEKMLEGGYTLGGEQSGHFIFIEDNTTGDGALSALKLIEAMLDENKTVSELNAYMKTYPQVLRNAKVANDKKYRYMEDEVVAKAVADFEEHFADKGRVLIRPSGTEPLVRVMVEGSDLAQITKQAEDLVQLIEKQLG